MKTIKLLLSVCASLSLMCGYAQNRENSPLVRYARENVFAVPTTAEDVSMLRDSYHFMYFRNPADSVANLSRFIETIDRIVPISDEKSEKIKAEALAAVRQQRDKQSLSEQMDGLIYSVDKHITLMGTNVIDVIRSNFNDADFSLLYETLEREMRWAIYAHSQLQMKQIKAQKETGATTRSVPKTLENSSRKEALDSVFDEFNID